MKYLNESERIHARSCLINATVDVDCVNFCFEILTSFF